MKAVALPFPIRSWNYIGQYTGSLLKVDLSEDSLINAAINAEKLDEFGDEYFRIPLNKLLESIESEAQLHSFGRFVVKQRLVGLLRNRLRAEHYFKKYPEILDIPLETPLVIAGLQRSGTTFLHRLISSVSEIRSLKSWEALNPAPPIRWVKEKDTRIKEGKRAENGLRYLNPSFFTIHPVEYDSPEEEVLLLDISFLSTVAEATMHVPTFSKWLEQQDQEPAYAYMKKLLQLLVWQSSGKRWVLKTPHHLEYLDVLRKVFPDSTIIQTHRDPILTVPSLCSMIWHGRFIFSNAVEEEQVAHHWLNKIERMIKNAASYRASVDNHGFIDVHYDQLIHSPTAIVEDIFEKADIPLAEQDIRRVEQALKSNTKNRYGSHRYKLEDFGLTDEMITDRLATIKSNEHKLK